MENTPVIDYHALKQSNALRQRTARDGVNAQKPKGFPMTEYHDQSAAFVINDIITHSVKGGHPKARRLAEDYNSERKGLMEANPNMPIGLTVVEALRGLLEQAYGIQFYASVADMLENVAEHGMSREDAQAVVSVADLIRDGNVAINDPNIGNDH